MQRHDQQQHIGNTSLMFLYSIQSNIAPFSSETCLLMRTDHFKCLCSRFRCKSTTCPINCRHFTCLH